MWCQENSTRRHANFRFDHLNIQSKFYNPQGARSASEVTLPVADGSVDRIILQSVFTHMFEPDVTHFLREFRRALRRDGRVFASFFVLGEESVRLALTTPDVLTFRHSYGRGCRINEPDNPEAAVGYVPKTLDRMVRRSGFAFDQPLHVGSWCGRQGVDDGQDIAILKPSGRVTWRGRPRDG